MSDSRRELPCLNVFWVGPPRIDPSGDLGSDVKDVIAMVKRAHSNPINFFCLDEHVEHYKKLFSDQGVSITVKSIDAYLEEKKNQSDNPTMREHAEKMQQMRNVLLQEPRNRIIDKVSFKDAFSLFVLANDGGYTMDTNIKLKEGSDEVVFPHHEKFKAPHTKGPFKDDPNVECWMMYASRESLSVPQKMLSHYLSQWDEIQKIIEGNETSVPHIMKFHDKITSLIILSIKEGQKLIDAKDRLDNDWYFNLEAVQASGIRAVATFNSEHSLPVVKGYGNTHVPEIECQKIITANIQALVNQSGSIKDNENRSVVVQKLQNQLSKYSECKSSKEVATLNTKLDRCFKALKELDKQVALLRKQYHLQNTDKNKLKSIETLEVAIAKAYEQLGKVTESKNYMIDTGYVTPEEVIKSFQEQVQNISKSEKKSTMSIFKTFGLGLEKIRDIVDSNKKDKQAAASKNAESGMVATEQVKPRVPGSTSTATAVDNVTDTRRYSRKG